MERKKLPEILFAVFCLITTLTLFVGYLIAGPADAVANEVLSAKPALTDAEGKLNKDLLAQYAEYFSGRFFLRRELITARNALSAAVGSSGSKSVIAGSGGWLYYADTLDDYTGANPMTAGELFSAARNLALMQEYCESRGVKFAFAIAPNKNSLYAENMPDLGARTDTRDAERLMNLLENQGVSFIDFFTAFGAESETLYFAHDSHWNSKGAALAADLINAQFGFRSAYYSDAFSESAEHTGDLFEMVYPAARDPERDLVYGGGLNYTREGGETRADSITIRTSGAGEYRLLAYRDSFGNLLYPYLADSTEAAMFSRASNYDLTRIDAARADCVLIELVERNLRNLANNLPVMPAPRRNVQATKKSAALTEIATDENSPEGLVLVTGKLPSDADAVTPAYISCSGATYEAFTLAGGSFGAYLPENAEPEGVLYLSGGEITYSENTETEG